MSQVFRHVFLDVAQTYLPLPTTIFSQAGQLSDGSYNPSGLQRPSSGVSNQLTGSRLSR